MTEADFKKHLEAAEKSPKLTALAVSGLPDKTLRYKPAPEKWSILEILGHLADVEIVFGHRIRQMLAGPKSTITPMDQEAWARNLGYRETPPAEMIAVYGVNRHANLQILRRLKVADLEKSAFHPELKREFHLAEIVEELDTHSANHLGQIEALKKRAQEFAG
jgi:DinB superfamily